MGLTMASRRMRGAPQVEAAPSDDSDDGPTAGSRDDPKLLRAGATSAKPSTTDHDIFSKARNNRHGEVDSLLSSGAVSPDVRDRNGNTVLMVAAQNNRKRVAKAAVRAGATLDARNAKGNTAMHFALAYGYEDIAEYLVRKGADPTVTNEEGLRPDQGLTKSTTRADD